MHCKPAWHSVALHWHPRVCGKVRGLNENRKGPWSASGWQGSTEEADGTHTCHHTDTQCRSRKHRWIGLVTASTSGEAEGAKERCWNRERQERGISSLEWNPET